MKINADHIKVGDIIEVSMMTELVADDLEASYNTSTIIGKVHSIEYISYEEYGDHLRDYNLIRLYPDVKICLYDHEEVFLVDRF